METKTFPLRAKHVLALGALLVSLLTIAPGAQAQAAANPVIRVNFFVNGSIAVSLLDGTPVGTASGAPTVIPSGYYTLQMIGPGGCANVPYFELKGPGESVVDNMDEGELATNAYNAHFLPNSTYTWYNDDANPPVTYTFATSSDSVGTVPVAAGSGGNTSANHGTAQSTNPFSTAPKLVGKLTGVVSATGKLSLAYKGKSVKALAAGKYKVAVVDKSAKSGFMLRKTSKIFSVTSASFVGTHTIAVTLTAGKWLVAPKAGATSYAITVK